MFGCMFAPDQGLAARELPACCGREGGWWWSHDEGGGGCVYGAEYLTAQATKTGVPTSVLS